jgi:hypothetical protein
LRKYPGFDRQKLKFFGCVAKPHQSETYRARSEIKKHEAPQLTHDHDVSAKPEAADGARHA